MALVEISKNVMINTSSVDAIESIAGSIVVVVGDNRYEILDNKTEVISKIMQSLSVPETMMKNNQFFGG